MSLSYVFGHTYYYFIKSNHENQIFCLNPFIKVNFIKHVLLFKIFFSSMPEVYRREYIKNVLKELKRKVYAYRWYSRDKQKRKQKTEDGLLHGRTLHEVADSGRTVPNE